jgi:hypothetical protein
MTVVEHHSAEELQALFRQEREARRAKRIWTVWQARLGRTAPQIAQGHEHRPSGDDRPRKLGDSWIVFLGELPSGGAAEK